MIAMSSTRSSDLSSRLIIDASPLIILFKAEFSHLLPEMFDELYVPDAVWNEIMAGPEDDVARQNLPTFSQIKRVTILTVSTEVIRFDLGSGESESIELALDTPNAKLLIDDAAGRICARRLGISILGTGALLVLAKKNGLIPSVTRALQTVRASGLWMDVSVTRTLIERAGE